MLRYALLRHECPADYRDGPHWDLMLERAGSVEEHRLATWSLLELPAPWATSLRVESSDSAFVVATLLPDHRVNYLDYEGPVSQGRGEVHRLATGGLDWVETKGNRVLADLLDGDLAGSIDLVRQADGAWRLATG